MATMTFSKSSGVLNWPNFGSWTAVSGGWGDPLPTGIYIGCSCFSYTLKWRTMMRGAFRDVS